MKDKINAAVEHFSSTTHGSTDFYKDRVFVMGTLPQHFSPLRFLSKQIEEISSENDLLALGYNMSDYNFLEQEYFAKWYLEQFGRKLTAKDAKEVRLLHYPDQIQVFEAVEVINRAYEVLKKSHVIMNGKNFPVQLGEWYAKCIFGLYQKKSSSQRGFDFYINQSIRVEVKVHWSERTAFKGVKIKKSLLELSEHCIIIYLENNFTIRDILFLDSNFVLRKFSTKGHTIFLKDPNVSSYFFSKSAKHFDKVTSRATLMKYASPSFAMKIQDTLLP